MQGQARRREALDKVKVVRAARKRLREETRKEPLRAGAMPAKR